MGVEGEVRAVLFCVGVVACGFTLAACTDETKVESAPPAPAAPPASTSSSGTALLPPIGKFLAAHSEFAPVTNAQPKAAWAAGERQVADTAKGPAEFYVEKDEVVAVWRQGHGEKLWEKAGYKPPDPQDKTQKSVAATSSFPQYTVLETVKLMTGGKHGDVLAPSLSKKTSAGEREAFLKHLMQSEGLSEATLYCSKDAQKADASEKFAKAHPRARDCMLGIISPDTGGKLLE